MKKIFFILILSFIVTNIIEACPKCRIIEAKSACLGGSVAVKFQADWNESDCDCPPDGNLRFRLQYNQGIEEGYQDVGGGTGNNFSSITIPSSQLSKAGHYQVFVTLRGTCSNGFVGWGPESQPAQFSVVELVFNGYEFCDNTSLNSNSKDFATCLNEGKVINALVSVVPGEFTKTFSKLPSSNPENESNATLDSSTGDITMGDKYGSIDVKVVVDEFNSCSEGLDYAKCCDTGKGVFFVPYSLTITSDCDSSCTKEVTNTGEPKLEMAVVLKKEFEDNGFESSTNKAQTKAKINFVKATKPAGFEDQLEIEDVEEDSYEFTKSETKDFVLKCICEGSVKVSAKVNAYQIEIISPGEKLVKDNPIQSKGYEVEDINNEQTRGDLRGSEPLDNFGDDDHAEFTVKVIEGPDTDYELKIEVIKGKETASIISDDNATTDTYKVSNKSEVELKLLGLKHSEDSKDVHVEVTLKHNSDIPTSNCSVGVAKTVLETETWEEPIVYNPRPYVTINNVTYVGGALFVTGTVQDWTCSSIDGFLRKNINNTEANQTSISSSLDISSTQPLSATWSANVPIREGSGNSFVVTAAFQNILKNFGVATAKVNLTQDNQGKIINATIGEKNSKPNSLESIKTFTITAYDASGGAEPSVPWKLRASSGHELDVESDESKIEYPKFVSKSYATMLDNFNGEPPLYVLKAKPGDRLINLLECGDLNAAEYINCKGLYLGGSIPIESVNLNPGENGVILGTLGGDFGDKKHVTFKSIDSAGNEIGTKEFEFDRVNLFQELSIDYHKYNLEEGIAIYLWDGKSHDSIKTEGGGELQAEADSLTSFEPTLHIEIVTPPKISDPASGPANITWSKNRDEFYDGEFKNDIKKLDEPLEELVGLAVTDILPVLELDTSLKPNDITISEKTIDGKKRYFGSFLLKGIVRDSLANINLEAKINFVNTINWSDVKNEAERINIDLMINDEKISPSKPYGHTSSFNRLIKSELIHGENYIRVISGRNALGASTDASYLIKATERIIDASLGTKELIIDKVITLNIEDPTIRWSPYFANIRNGLLYKETIPEKISVGNAEMKTDHLYEPVIEGSNFYANQFNNWSSKVFTLLPFPAKKPNTEYNMPLNGEINPNFGFISNEGSSQFTVTANDLKSNKTEVFSVDLDIKNLGAEDEADKGFYLRKTENIAEPKSDCQPEYPVMIDLKTSTVIQKLLKNNKGELKLEVIKSKRTPDVSLGIKLANGQKITNGGIKITEADQQIEVLGLENGVAELKLSYQYDEFYTQDIIRIVVCGLDFIQPRSIAKQIPQRIFDPKPFLKINSVKWDKTSEKVIIEGEVKDWTGNIFMEGNLYVNGQTEVKKATDTVDLNIHGVSPEFKPIPSFGKFKRSVAIPNSGLKGYRISVIYKNFLNNFSESSISIQPNLKSDESIIDIASNVDYSYPKSLEDIEPYLFRAYLHDSNSEFEEELSFNFTNNIVSGSQSIRVFTDPLYSPVHVSERLVVVPLNLERPEDQVKVQKNLISGWVGARETLNYTLKSTEQKVSSESFVNGIMIVKNQGSDNVTRIISGINSDMKQDPRSLSVEVIAGFGTELCSATDEITVKIKSLDSEFGLTPRFNDEYPETKLDIVLKRVGNYKSDNDFHYYSMKTDKLIVNHQKTVANIDNYIQVSGFGGGFLEASNSAFTVNKPIAQASFLKTKSKIDTASDNNAWQSEPSYICPSIIIPKINLVEINKADITISEDTGKFKAIFEVKGNLEDFVADLVDKKEADLKFVLINDELVDLEKKQIKAHHFYQPFLFIGEFKKIVSASVNDGHNLIPVKTSRNSSGNSSLVLIDLDVDIKNKKVKSVDIIDENLESIFNPFIPSILGGVKYTDSIKELKLAVNEKESSLFDNFEWETIKYSPYFPVKCDIYRQNPIIFLEEKIATPLATNLQAKMGPLIESINVHEYVEGDVLLNKSAGSDEVKTQLQSLYVDIDGFNAENKLVEAIDELEYGLSLNPNIDDDNADGTTDNKENNPAANEEEDDLGRISIKFNQPNLLVEGKGKLILSVTNIKKDVGKIRIWSGDKLILDDKNKAAELTNDDLSKEFKIEGSEVGEMYLKLAFTMNDYEAVDIMRVKCVIYDFEIIAMTTSDESDMGIAFNDKGDVSFGPGNPLLEISHIPTDFQYSNTPDGKLLPQIEITLVCPDFITKAEILQDSPASDSELINGTLYWWAETDSENKVEITFEEGEEPIYKTANYDEEPAKLSSIVAKLPVDQYAIDDYAQIYAGILVNNELIKVKSYKYILVSGKTKDLFVMNLNNEWVKIVDNFKPLDEKSTPKLPPIDSIVNITAAATELTENKAVLKFKAVDLFDQPVQYRAIDFSYAPKELSLISKIYHRTNRAELVRKETDKTTDKDGLSEMTVTSGPNSNGKEVFINVKIDGYNVALGDPLLSVKVSEVEFKPDDAKNIHEIKVRVVSKSDQNKGLSKVPVRWVLTKGSLWDGAKYLYGSVYDVTDENGYLNIKFTNSYYNENGTIDEFIAPATGLYSIMLKIGGGLESVYTGEWQLPRVQRPLVLLNDPFIVGNLPKNNPNVTNEVQIARLFVDDAGDVQFNSDDQKDGDKPIEMADFGQVDLVARDEWGVSKSAYRFCDPANDELFNELPSNLSKTASFDSTKIEFVPNKTLLDSIEDILFGQYAMFSGISKYVVENYKGRNYTFNRMTYEPPQKKQSKGKTDEAYVGIFEESQEFNLYYLNTESDLSAFGSGIVQLDFFDKDVPSGLNGYRIGVAITRNIIAEDVVEFFIVDGAADGSPGSLYKQLSLKIPITDVSDHDVLRLRMFLCVEFPDPLKDRKVIKLKAMVKNETKALTFNGEGQYSLGRGLDEWPLPTFIINNGTEFIFNDEGGVGEFTHRLNSGISLIRDANGISLNGAIERLETDASDTWGVPSKKATTMVKFVKKLDDSHFEKIEVEGRFAGWNNNMDIPDNKIDENLLWKKMAMKARTRSKGQVTYITNTYPVTNKQIIGEFGGFFKGFIWERDERYRSAEVGELIGGALAIGDAARILKQMLYMAGGDPDKPVDVMELGCSVIGVVLACVPGPGTGANFGFKTLMATMKKEMIAKAILKSGGINVGLSYMIEGGVEIAIQASMLFFNIEDDVKKQAEPEDDENH